MLVYLGFYKRKPGLSWEQFSTHWREVHGPLLRDTPEIAKYLKRYVQHHLAPNTEFPEAVALGYDGFSEAWFDSAEDRRAMWALPVYQRLMVPDEALFLDLSATRISVLDRQAVQVAGDPAFVLASAPGQFNRSGEAISPR